jgi:hypothetical protein
MGEIWKDVKGYEGKYQVSSFGNIRSIAHSRIIKVKARNQFSDKVYETQRILKVKGKLKKLSLGSHGYYVVNLGFRDIKSVHRLVAEAFCDGYSDLKRITNHINGIKTDNRANNLEWATYTENLNHAYDLGLNKRRKKPTVEKYR